MPSSTWTSERKELYLFYNLLQSVKSLCGVHVGLSGQKIYLTVTGVPYPDAKLFTQIYHPWAATNMLILMVGVTHKNLVKLL